jgi:serine/threonine protein kinase
MNICPETATLALFGNQSLERVASSGLVEHIESCAICQARLNQLVENDAGGAEELSALLPGPTHAPEIPGFVIERELGRGGMGVVYQARQPSLNRRVALKIVPSGPQSGSHEYTRWVREARSLSRVRHENVVRLYQVGEANGWLYLVLELIPGGPLRDRLETPFVARDAARLVEIIAGAVAAIHREGILHLDLKPSNILLDGPTELPREQAKPMVSDFGIAFVGNDPDMAATATGTAGPLGTPRYMAPEQIDGKRSAIGPAADIYGLGAILYHVLTGHPPFSAPSVSEMFDWIRSREPVPPRRLNPAIPRDLETICLKCLHKDPGRRYASAEALAADLRSWIDDRPIKARPVSLAERGWRSCRRRPLIAALTAALTLTLSVGFVAVVLLWRQAEAARLLAEANFRTSNEALRDLMELSAGGEASYPKPMTLDRLIPLYEQIRKRLLALAARRPDDLSLARLLASVENSLYVALTQAGRNEDARTVALESLANLDMLRRRYPSDEALRATQGGCLCFLSEMSDFLGKKEDCVTYLRRAVQSSEEANRVAPTADMTARFVQSRRKFAWLLHVLGDFEKAGAYFASNRRQLQGLPLECESPNVAVARLQAHIDSKLFIECSPLGVAREQRALDSGDSAPLSAIASPTDASQPPEEWARLAALALRSQGSNRAVRARRESENALALAESLFGIASMLRRSRNIEGARRVADRMHALGDRFVATYPDQAAAHLTLSQAYFQFCKNAWQIKDRVAVESNLRAALDAAQQARLRDLTSEIAHQAVDSLQRRLVALKAPLKPARSPGPPP